MSLTSWPRISNASTSPSARSERSASRVKFSPTSASPYGSTLPVQLRADAASYDKPGEDHCSTWDRLTERDWLRAEHGTSDTLHDQLEARELVRRVNQLRPQQRVALTCRMLGLSYEEAMQATGHTYTWVNRHITEGRRALEATS